MNSSSFISNNRNNFHVSDAKYSLKKIDKNKMRFLSSIGDNGDIPECVDLLEFFDEKLNVVTTKIKNLVLDARVCKIEAGNVIVDMNLKNRGRFSKDELRIGAEQLNIAVGNVIKVVAESIDAVGSQYIRVSWEKARRIALWEQFEQYQKDKTVVYGMISGDTRGGYVANIQGVKVFIPGSHLDFKPLERHALEELKSVEQPFIILSMERDEKTKKDNIVVSRREVLNQERMKVKDVAINQIKVGDVLKGVIKSIAPYGCFVNLKIPGIDMTVDGLLHINDISWSKVGHPSELVSIGDEVEVVVISLTPSERKISLGMKQLKMSPWKGLTERLKIGSKVHGVIKNTTEYGYFVEIEDGIEGLVHVSEMSWSKKSLNLSVGQEVEVMILAIDEEKTRISLSIKQCFENPWKKFSEKNKIGSVIPIIIKKIVDFGIFVDLKGEIEGLIHISDVSWSNDAQKIISSLVINSTINAKILSIDIEKNRIALGLKQLIRDYFNEFLDKTSVNDIIRNCVIVGSWNDKLEIEIPEAKTVVSLNINTLGSINNEDKHSVYGKGQTLDCKVAEIDKDNRKIVLVGVNYELKKEDDNNSPSATEVKVENA
jgi:small subunit ribosomal protein S1